MARDSRIAALVNSDRTAGGASEDLDPPSHGVAGETSPGRFLRSAVVTLFLVAIALFGVGFLSFFRATANNEKEGLLVVDSAVKSFGDALSGQRVVVAFSLTNQSRQPIRIVGATRVCGRHGCLDIDNLPVDIPPLSGRNIVASVETREPGEFNGEITLFSDGPGQPTMVLTVYGRVIED
jgi:hypothetical protein